MEINKYRKFYISYQIITFKTIQSRERKMNTLMKYIQMVLTNMKEQLFQKNIYNLEILIHPLELFQIVILLWVVVEIAYYVRIR